MTDDMNDRIATMRQRARDAVAERFRRSEEQSRFRRQAGEFAYKFAEHLDVLEGLPIRATEEGEERSGPARWFVREVGDYAYVSVGITVGTSHWTTVDVVFIAGKGDMPHITSPVDGELHPFNHDEALAYIVSAVEEAFTVEE